LSLVIFIVVVGLTAALGFVLGALPHGVDYLMSLVQQQPQPGAAAAPAPQAAELGGFNLGHLWFLYYLLIFYVLTLAIRWLVLAVDPRGTLAAASDRVLALVMRGVWAPVLIALPIALYLYQHESWAEWLGLPAPFLLTPNVMAIVGYGVAFSLGWLLNRQVQLLLDLQRLWIVYLVAAIALTVFCLQTIGATPRWAGPNLEGTDRMLYTAAYVVALWCWVFAFVGAAVRYLSTPHAVTRYLADASYWIYLMHLSTLIFFITLLRPFDLHWSIKLAISVGGSMPILLLTYHWFVRFTWIGAMLNGRRHPRPEKSPPPDTAPAPG